MPIRVTVAGEVSIDIDGVAVDMAPLGRLGRLFWSYLVCERHGAVAKYQLAEVLWGEEALPRSWEQMLRGNASKLRAALTAAVPQSGIEVISAFGAYQVRLPPGATVDVEEAAALAEQGRAALAAQRPAEALEAATAAAVIAARGFLPGWSGIWVERRQVHLREVRLRALEAVAGAACALERWEEAATAAEEAIGLEPFRESAHVLVMAAHRGAGNPAEGLRAYQRCRRVLADELGVNPSAATETAYLELLSDDATRLAEPSTAIPLPSAVGPVPGVLLVGRSAESARLQTVLEQAKAHRQAVMIGGEPGIGKTALVAAFARDVHGAGGTVLYGRCDEDLSVAYQPFAEAIGHYMAHCRRDELEAHVAGHGNDLARLTPELARRLPDLTIPTTSGSEGDRYRLFEAVVAMVEAVCRRHQLVLILDDLHWAARPTLALLRRLLRTTSRSFLVIGMYRHTEVGPDHPLTTLLADLHREPAVTRFALDGLNEDGVSALVSRTEGEPTGDISALAHALHARTAGNPFFVGEFLRHLAESGAVIGKTGPWSFYEDPEGLGVPEGVREVVARRVGRLSPTANRILALASVMGMDFELQVLEQLEAAAEREAVLDSLDDAVAAHVVTESATGRYQFSHALVRDTIYTSLTAARRARIHHRVGDALAGLPGDPGPRLAALARHYSEAVPDGAASEAGRYALAAARQAFASAAWEDALTFINLGLRALENGAIEDFECRFDLQMLAYETVGLTLTGEVHGCCFNALTAAEEARVAGSPERMAAALSLYLFGHPDDEQATGMAAAVLADLGDTSPAARARVLASLAVRAEPGRPAGSPARAEAALQLARDSGDGDAIHAALVASAHHLAASARAREWLAVEEELRDLGPTSGPVTSTRWKNSSGRGYAIASLVLGDRAAFEQGMTFVERRYQQIRNPGLGAQVALWRVNLALLDGRFDQVEPLAAAARAMSPAASDMLVDEWAFQMAKLALERGRVGEFKDELARVAALRTRNRMLASVLAFAHAETGAADDALAIVRAFAPEGFAHARIPFSTTTLAYTAEVVVALGDVDLAVKVYDYLAQFTGLVAASGLASHCPGAVDRYLGQLAALLQRWDEAARHYETAVRLESGLRSPPLLARTRYWYGRMLIERGRPGDADRAHDLLMVARATAETLGMARLAEQATVASRS